jgi:hypothetical protein
VAVATVVVEVAAALMVAEAARPPALITKFLNSTKGPFLSFGMGLFYCLMA